MKLYVFSGFQAVKIALSVVMKDFLKALPLTHYLGESAIDCSLPARSLAGTLLEKAEVL